MCARARWYVALFVVLGFEGEGRPSEGAAIDPGWLAKARTEVKASYEKYKALSLRLEEECEYRSDKAPGPAGTMPFRPQTRRERSARLGDNMILEQIRILDNAPNRPQIGLQCDNSDYNFTLGKSQEGSSYALVDYTVGPRKVPLIGGVSGLHGSVFWHLHHTLAAIENEPKHTLRTLRFDEAKGLLQIEYKFSAGNTPAEEQVYLDPSHDWRVVEHRVETPNLVGTERWTYGITAGGLEFPTGVKDLIIYKVAKAPPNMDITGRLISLKLTDKTPADFRMSAFGLPEPVDAPPLEKPTRWYLWILAAAGVSAALSFGFTYLRRRRLARRTAVQGVSP